MNKQDRGCFRMYMHWQESRPVISQDNINAKLQILEYACMIAIQGVCNFPVNRNVLFF